MTTIQNKLLVVLIVLSSLIGYLEWGGNHRSFLFEIEIDVISKLFSNPTSIIHPLTILPMIGQVMLILSLIINPLNKKLVYWGIALIGVLILLIFFIGMISFNWKIIICSIPFLIFSGMFVYFCRK